MNISPIAVPDTTRVIEQSLKVFSILSVKKTQDWNAIKQDFHITLLPAYDANSALLTNIEIMRASGIDTNEYLKAALMVSMDYDALIPKSQLGIMLGKIVPEFTPKDESTKLKKSIDEMVSYVRYVFEGSSPEESAVMEQVLVRFKTKYEPRTENISSGDQSKAQPSA